MKKKIVIALGIIFVIAIGMIAIIKISGFANRPDGTTDVMEFSEVKGLVLLKGYTQEEIEEKLKGECRDNLLVSWGEPDGMLSGMWGDIWFLDDAEGKKIIVYYDSDGYVENVLIRGNEEMEKIADATVIEEIRNDITNEIAQSWAEIENAVMNYEHIVPIYFPYHLSDNVKIFSDTLAPSNQYIAPAVSDGKCIGAFIIVEHDGKWVVDSYIAGLDIETGIQQHEATALCFVGIPQFSLEYGFLTVSDTEEIYTSLTATFDKNSSGEELLERLLEKTEISGVITEG